MRKLSISDKKGVSEMISYVLLIVIAITISILTYTYLKVYVPKEKPECPDSTSLVLESYQCFVTIDGGYLNVSLVNRGLFKIDAVYIRVGEEEDVVKAQINKGVERLNITLNGQEYFGLPPGERYERFFFISSPIDEGEQVLEIQPALFSDNKLAACPAAILTRKINCIAQ